MHGRSSVSIWWMNEQTLNHRAATNVPAPTMASFDRLPEPSGLGVTQVFSTESECKTSPAVWFRTVRLRVAKRIPPAGRCHSWHTALSPTPSPSTSTDLTTTKTRAAARPPLGHVNSGESPGSPAKAGRNLPCEAEGGVH